MTNTRQILWALALLSLAGLAAAAGTCTGTYPSYFQDPAFAGTGMWKDQVIINRAPPGWQGPVFKLSDGYASAKPETGYPWEKFNPFDRKLSEAEKAKQALAYINAVMDYIQEGNVDSGDVATDWTLCDNKVRPWYHIPYQTYEPMSGREFVHGLTREAPVTLQIDKTYDLKSTIWAVGFYNPAAGNSIAEVWSGKPAPNIPTSNFAFNDGSVIGKLLFTTATPEQAPFLTNMPAWQANISAPEFCKCDGCSFTQQTEQCPRTLGTVYLVQFDIAVRDSRSPIGWAYGTFVADGQNKAKEPNPWKRFSPLGLMWGNDKPPKKVGAVAYPKNPRKNGFKDGVIFWTAVDTLNAHTNAGHLGCNSRLNGPADNAQSSCLSCHQTASVPDQDNKTPAIIFQFSGLDKNAGQCQPKPKAKDLRIDQVYFETLQCSQSFGGPADIVPPPRYASGQTSWISTDFSLQLAISLSQWQEWQQDQSNQQLQQGTRVFDGNLPAR